MRRTAEQEHAVLLTVDPDGTERVLIDPMAHRPVGADHARRVAAVQGGRPARLPAVRGRHRGVRRPGDRRRRPATLLDGPIDRARYSPIAWLPGGAAYYYVRRLPPELVPAGEEQFHRRVYLHRVGTDPADDVLVFGEGRKATDYYGVSVSRDGRWLQVSAAEGTAPRNDLWLADLERVAARGTPAACPSRSGSTPRPACTWAATAGSTCSPTSTRRAAGWP